jgi:hypothetical protein
MKMRMLAVVAVCLFSYGCGNGGTAGRVSVFQVTGTIKLAGGPLPGAQVAFVSSDDQPVALGTTDDSGAFKLTTYEADDGAAAGKYSVVVTKYKNESVGEALESEDENYGKDSGHDAQGAETTEETNNLVPSQFAKSETTTLKATVEAGGENKFDFDLK